MPEIGVEFKSFNPQLEKLKGTVLREIQGARTIVSSATQSFIVTAFCDYKACRALCADDRPEKFPGQAELVNRATLECIFNFFFIAEAPSDRWDWYIGDGLRGMKKEYDDLQNAYSGIAECQPSLARRADAIRDMENFYGVSAGASSTAERWPTPGKMIGYQGSQPLTNPYGFPSDQIKFLAEL